MLRFLPFLTVLLLPLLCQSAEGLAEEPEFRVLWPDGAPDAKGDKDTDKPGVWVYPARDNPNGAAVVICPGGGYAIHATDHEGVQPARFFNRMGLTAFVLRYRLSPYRHPVPLHDAQRALRYVRAHAKEFAIDPQRVGLMGFSAGGHLTSTALTNFDSGNSNAADIVDQQSCRPDFGILGYPVISFVSDFSHRGSARNLLGEAPSENDLKDLSSDLKVTRETPPTFLFHTAEDTGVPPQNSMAFYAACLKAGVPAELHIYQHGPHGVGLANGHPALSGWIGAAGTWLRQNAFLTKKPRAEVSGTITVNGEPLKWGTIAFEPKDQAAPTGWAMVRNGQYSIPKASGPVTGEHHVIITSMGAVAPGPTAEDAEILHKDLTASVQADARNVFEFTIKR